MSYLIDNFGPALGLLFSSMFIFLRYAVFAGLAFLVFYTLRPKAIRRLKIQAKVPSTQKMLSEVGHSAATALVFALIGLGLHQLRQLGWTQIYLDPGDFGSAYLIASTVFLIFLHDAYFYWAHRWMHLPTVFRRVHRVHHQSFNPTPWSSLAFHPLEAALEVAIVPLAACLIPLHPIALFAFATWSLLWNVLGHAGFEVFPRWLVDHPIGKYLNTPTHHNLHHQQGNGNFSLYFNFWDRWMGTMHKHYETTFFKIKEKKEQRHSTRTTGNC